MDGHAILRVRRSGGPEPVNPLVRLKNGWTRFCFEPRSTSSLALFRIAFGIVVFAWTVSLVTDLFAFFAHDGVLPDQPSSTVFNLHKGGAWGLLDIFPGRAAIVILFVLLLLGSVALVVGFHTRIAAAVVFLGVLSFERRNPFVFNSGDYLIRNFAFLLMLAPAGASLSLDRLRHAKDRFWEFPVRAPWAMRLIQIQVSVLYLSAVWDKVQGQSWNSGIAVPYALRVSDLERLPLPNFVRDDLLLGNLQTYGTLATEFSLGVLLWNRVARPYVIAAGIAMHLFIDYSMRVGLFSFAIISAYLMF